MLRERWGIAGQDLNYVPLGAGSHHWSLSADSGQKWFVTVDDLGADPTERDARYSRLRRAFEAAVLLRREADLGFVLCPAPDCTGQIVHRLGDRFAISVRLMLEGRAGAFGPYRAAEAAPVIDMLRRLHRATSTVATVADADDLALPGEDRLRCHLAESGERWRDGPLSDPARAMLTSCAEQVDRLLISRAQLVEQVGDLPFVVTHGEPHPGNVLQGLERLWLLDWDTCLLAPLERDLWMVGDGGFEAYRRYEAAGGYRISQPALKFYRLSWSLKNISVSLTALRRPHSRTAEASRSWNVLKHYLHGLESFSAFWR
ncbi:phosphotransferase [Kribbella speibonae]|uniref:Phosphotransferase n=2 Tax=Kribbella speibonae TaxID=1572660 RepID=A0A4R0II05_9ACTN|nr:phosphotransferase [Kribbella speibonae]